MSKHKSTPLQLLQKNNLIGKEDHQDFLKILAAYGIARRGGSLPITFRPVAKRLVSSINLLSWQERKALIFSEIISKN